MALKCLLLAAAALACLAEPVFAQDMVPANTTDPARTAKPMLVWNPSCNPGGSPPGGYVGQVYSGSVCGLGDGPQPSVPINIATATTTTMIAGAAGKTIQVTHWDVIAGTGNFQWESGTGGCTANLTALTGPYALGSSAPGLSVGNGGASVLTVPAGKDLCAVTSAAVGYAGSVTYKQN